MGQRTWPVGSSIICINDSPIDGLKDGKLSIAKGNTYKVEEFKFELNGIIQTLDDYWVCIQGDNGRGIVCRSGRFERVQE